MYLFLCKLEQFHFFCTSSSSSLEILNLSYSFDKRSTF
jgi:hypothetical protein